MVWVVDLKDHLILTACHQHGHLKLDRLTQSPIHLGLEHFEGMEQLQLLWSTCACEYQVAFVIAEQCSHSQGLCCSSPTPPARALEVYKELGGDTGRTADPKTPKRYPDHAVSCSAHKAGANKMED